MRAIDSDPAVDALIEAEVAAAVRPYEAIYTPAHLDELRHMLRIALRTHPTAKHLLEQIRPRAIPEESGKEDVRMFNGVRPPAKRAEGK